MIRAGRPLWLAAAVWLMAAGLATAAAELSVSCTVLDDCYCHETDAEIDPAELIVLVVAFENVGDAPIEGLSGRIDVVSGADPLRDDGAFGPLPSAIGPGEVHRRGVSYRVTVPCGGWVDVDVTELAASGLPDRFPDELSACDRQAGAGGNCESCCLPVDIDPIRPIYLRKPGDRAIDLQLLWSPDPEPSASHYNTWTVAGFENRQHIPEARDGGPWPAVPGCRRNLWTDCRHSGGLVGAPGSIIYYQVRGLCDLIEAAE